MTRTRITNRTLIVWVATAALMLGVLGSTKFTSAEDWEHGYAQSGDIKIHYVAAGQGPLVIMIHGFPDYWYSWRQQIPELSKHFQVVAIDQRGYNKSDQPDGVENYSLEYLAEDVRNVASHFGKSKAILVGHDWGGYVAWTCAMRYPDLVERLVILNAPHPAGLSRELRNNPQQYANSQYARNFQQADAANSLTAVGLASWVKDPQARKKYIEAFERSSFEGMLNYYKANYPRTPEGKAERPVSDTGAAADNYPKIKCPVLVFHGLQDRYLLPAGLNDSWNWIDNELTIVTVPEANHFVQQDAADLVTNRIANWLK